MDNTLETSNNRLLTKNKYQKNVYLYYLITFFSSLQFQRGIFLIYLAEIGLTNTKIGILQSTLFFASFLFEIPTGYLGDKIGRKWSVIIGVVLSFIQAIGMILFKKYLIFLILFVFKGISMAFMSGANQALLYDSLKYSGNEEKYLKVNSKVQSIGTITLGIAILLGGYMRIISWNLVYIGYAGALVIALFLLAFIYENKSEYKSDGSSEDTPKDTVSSDFAKAKIFMKDKKIRAFLVFVLAAILFEAVMTPYFVYAQSLFSFYSLSTEYIGLIYSVVQISSGFVFLFSEKVSERFTFKKIIIFILVSSITLVILNAIVSLPLALVSFFISTIFTDILYILRDNHIQNNIPSNLRATLLSLVSFFEVLLTSLIYVFIGYFMDVFKMNYAISLLSVFLIISFILFIIYFKVSKVSDYKIEDTSLENGENSGC